MEEIVKLIPNWEIDKRYVFEINKKDAFNYKNRNSKEYKRSYSIELTRNNKTVFEAYFPKSILYPVKLFNVFDENIYDNPKINSRTFYYEVDKNGAFEKLLNLKEIITSLKYNAKTLLSLFKNNEEKEEFETRISTLLVTEERIEKYLLEDIINIHYNYGLDLEIGIYYDLLNESFLRKILKIFFKKSRYFLNKLHLIKFDLEDDNLTVEFLKGTENLSSKKKINWTTIEQDFMQVDFDVINYKNITLNHEKYYYSLNDKILRKYIKKHIIDTPNMRKEILESITRKNL